MKRGLNFGLFFVLACALSQGGPAFAALIAGESFDGTGYTSGASLSGLNGGTGWAAGWTTVTTPATYPIDIISGNLGNYTGLVNAGAHMRTWAEGNGTIRNYADRLFSTAITDDGGTYWWAFQIALNDGKNGSHWTLTEPGDLHANNQTANPIFTTTGDDATVDFKFGTTTTLFSGDASYTPRLVVVKVQMSGDASNETLTAYVNPNLAADPVTWTGTVRSVAYNSGFDGIRWAGNRASSSSFVSDVYIDEIRVATTWQEAVGQPIPEPSAMLLFVMGLLGLAMGARRRR